ncbi:MAG: preprotein translocase subunit SecA [bacterium]
MFNLFLQKLFGTQNKREIKRISLIVNQVNDLEAEIKNYSDQKLKEKMEILKQKSRENQPLNNLLIETFALVRESSKRVLGERPYDVQIIGCIVLHEGKIAEMKTGEGKTLTSTMPICLNALTGKGVHIITVNDYLAKRDAEWMKDIYHLLGFTVDFIQTDTPIEQKQIAYNSDITYGTNNEFGFDYLRDNMVISYDHKVQKELNYAIVDEVDSILIDEARTPLIISGPAEESTDLYYQIDKIIPLLQKDIDYQIDEKAHTSVLIEAGVTKTEKLLNINNLYESSNLEIVHHINQALRAHTLYRKEVDYLIKDGEIIIVDEFTGRLMEGRRYSDGLHQALEAKEKVQIKRENQTLATITFQNYFRLYKKLAGMTGTASTEAEEFINIYRLEVISIPTNKPMIRKDCLDVIYKTEKEKFNAVIQEIKKVHSTGEPILVGTISIEKSEKLSRLLKKEGLIHTVLNAKYHEQEAEIIKRAGQHGVVTIATNMAGRGVDIKLGFEITKLNGLYIIGTERHESRRIDNQLRGRSGRQGDPGMSKFYISLEDDLMRIFGGEKIKNLMDRMKMPEGQVIEHPWLNKTIENAQKKVESHNFDIRKHVLEYDDVMNQQRSVIYEQRQKILKGESLKNTIFSMIEDILDEILSLYIKNKNNNDNFDFNELMRSLEKTFPIKFSINEEFKKLKKEELFQKLLEIIKNAYNDKEKKEGESNLRELEKIIMLQTIDSKWKEHLHNMDCLKEGIGLRAYGQKDPLLEYKKESYNMFMNMIYKIKEDVVRYIFIAQLVSQEPSQKPISKIFFGQSKTPIKAKKIGRNDICLCGSEKKYKACCGKQK